MISTAALAAPLAAGKLGEWEAWTAGLTGPRKTEFDDMNARHGLDEHRAYLQSQPDGSWFAQSVAKLDGLEPGATPPPPAVRRL